MKLIFMGPPGAGKGTIGEQIAKRYEIADISVGQELREEIARKTPLGKKIDNLLKGGNLAPNEAVYDLLRARLRKNDCKNGFLIDGFPRNLEQAKTLEHITPLDLIVVLQVPDEIVIERLSSRRVCSNCGETYNLKNLPPKKDGICDVCNSKLIHRVDDTPKAIAHRLDLYHSTTKLALDFYKNVHPIAEVDATGVVDEVIKRTIAAIESEIPQVVEKLIIAKK